MGSRRLLILTAPLLLAAPVHAQQTEEAPPPFSLPPAGTTPAPDTSRQGPELNVYRDQPRATPPVTAPTIIVPPAPAPSTSATQPPPARALPARPAPDRPRDTPAPDRPASVPAADSPADTAAPAGTDPAPAPMPSQSIPTPQVNAVETPEIEPAPVAEASDDGILPWVIGGALALVALIAAILLRRRRAIDRLATETEEVASPLVDPAPPVAPPTPEPVAVPISDLVEPASVEPASAEPAAATDRPWIDMDLLVSQARYSLMGVTIAYSLILHNRGDRPAQDILVRGVVGNAGAQQQALLTAFFAGQEGMPLHSAVAIAPGETVQLAGELRLASDQIVPVDMGQRSLLIPLAAFDAAYRWGPDESEPTGHGRTARAFIVGQEQEPPADRLAPFRLDQGPRQYRRAAARAAAELTPA